MTLFMWATSDSPVYRSGSLRALPPRPVVAMPVAAGVGMPQAALSNACLPHLFWLLSGNLPCRNPKPPCRGPRCISP